MWIAIVIIVVALLAALATDKKSDGYSPGTHGYKPTYTDDVYKAWADQLYQAMNIIGTDEDTIYFILQQLRNPADWSKLYNAFGYRDNTVFIDSFDGGNLLEWLYKELDSKEFAKVRNILKNINVTI